MKRGNPGMMIFQISCLIKHEDFIAGIDNGIGRKQDMGTIIIKLNIPDVLSLAYTGDHRKIIYGKHQIRNFFT